MESGIYIRAEDEGKDRYKAGEVREMLWRMLWGTGRGGGCGFGSVCCLRGLML